MAEVFLLRPVKAPGAPPKLVLRGYLVLIGAGVRRLREPLALDEKQALLVAIELLTVKALGVMDKLPLEEGESGQSGH